MKIYPLFCTKEGHSANNISLGPNGLFGKCCPGLEPKARPEDIKKNIGGNGVYCAKVK